MTLEEVKNDGEYPRGNTILQRDDDPSVFDTAPRGASGWAVRPDWHIAGAMIGGEIEWCDLR